MHVIGWFLNYINFIFIKKIFHNLVHILHVFGHASHFVVLYILHNISGDAKPIKSNLTIFGRTCASVHLLWDEHLYAKSIRYFLIALDFSM